jgi:5'-methylthioadenosine phosphorylase
MIIGNLTANATATGPILFALMEKLGRERPSSPAHHALKDALMTAPDAVPAATRQRLDLFTSTYWGPATAHAQ